MYKTTNVITKEFYIGVHSTYNLNDGYLGSGVKLWRKIQEYGRDKFEKEILEFFETPENKFNREKELVNKEMLQDPLCMNLVKGGKYAHKPGFKNNEHQLKCSSAGGKACGEKIKHDKELYLKKAEVGRTNWKKLREKGVRIGCDWKGRKHKEETKLKIGAANSITQLGKNNSQFGTCWIYNKKLKQSKKILSKELEKYLEIGWLKGRKINFN